MTELPRYSFEEAEAEAFRMKESLASGESKDYSEAERKIEREKAITEINRIVELARKKRLIDNETANLVSEALKLEGLEALFANRVISRGSDPASLELALNGQISEPVMRAHRLGPGSLTADERGSWLTLAAVSSDEHAKAELPPSKKFEQFHQALKWLETATAEEKKAAADKELQKILDIPFEEGTVSDVKMRIYTSDRGFASAYWSGEEFAAVKEGDTIFVGSQKRTLEEIGIKVDKQLSPTFGILFKR